MLGLDE